jgi:hypothetical protein
MNPPDERGRLQRSGTDRPDQADALVQTQPMGMGNRLQNFSTDRREFRPPRQRTSWKFFLTI